MKLSICIGNSMICSDIWHKYHEWYFEIVIRNLGQFWNITSGIYAKYHVQIMLLFVYTTTCKRFVIFTCRYFKFSWNTTALSQSNCKNFSCSGIRWVIDTCLAKKGLCLSKTGLTRQLYQCQRQNYFKPWFTDLIKLTTNFTVHFLNVHHLINQHSKVLRNVIQRWCNS